MGVCGGVKAAQMKHIKAITGRQAGGRGIKEPSN